MKRGALCISILISMGLVFFVSSPCAKKPYVVSTPVTDQQPIVSEGSVTEKDSGPEEGDSVLAKTLEERAPLAGSHVVKSGECLWWISEYEDIYNDPFMWPLINNANRDRIKNPDLIYPGQILTIPRSGYSMEEVRRARHQAGAQRPYIPLEGSMPPIND
ncbi:MAG TPA: LysM peptidoglycan-binding domain-containing protein [Syntrophales bacterium]|mgnify:CR=1 FL=1|nr:LysM peptidoglycan-binding domain-containing protein [Syntrophales bacterium]HPQ42973.1 LysM peptidoglycan-binding domain-containing protein [Syntrophales bacterium]